MYSQLKLELHQSPKLGIILMILFAMVALFIYVPGLDPVVEVGTLVLTLAIFISAGLAWMVEEQNSTVSRWLIVLLWIIILLLEFVWLGLQEVLVFTTIPVILAVLLLGISAGVITAVLETSLLILLWWLMVPDLARPTINMMIFGIWMIVGLLAAAYWHFYQMAAGFETYVKQVSDLLEGSRVQKAELEQTFNDLAHANRELELLNERLDSMRLLAEEAQKAKTAFVAKISHEFRTPLNMIIGLIDTLTETPDVYGYTLPPELWEDLEIVHRNSQHLASLINDVLDLSQTDADRLVLHREWVDLAEDIDTAVAVVRPLLEKKQLSFQVNISDDLPRIFCDKTRIRQVILNLVSNAARYTERGGITLSTTKQGEDVVVAVADTGPGIAPEDLATIFDPFCQGSGPIWRGQGGSGLGLSISKQFIERHDGQIWLESEVGVGSTFSFRLPIEPNTTAPTTGPERWLNTDWVFLERTTWPNIPKSPYLQRVILCDETGDLYPTLASHFEKVEFIDTANLGQTVRELQSCPAHAVILNTATSDALPTLIQNARAQILDTPIIGCSLPPKPNQFLQAGATDFLIKPVIQDDLREAIQALDTNIKHVLIADDNFEFRQLLTKMLLSYDRTIEITTAANGEEALKIISLKQPDLILLDVVMPDMSGLEVLWHLQRNKMWEAIPVIMVTAEDPTQQPLMSEMMLATIAQGLTMSELLQCSLFFSRLMLEPGQQLDPMPG